MASAGDALKKKVRAREEREKERERENVDASLLFLLLFVRARSFSTPFYRFVVQRGRRIGSKLLEGEARARSTKKKNHGSRWKGDERDFARQFLRADLRRPCATHRAHFLRSAALPRPREVFEGTL